MTSNEKTIGIVVFVAIFLYLGWQIRQQSFDSYEGYEVPISGDNAAIMAANDRALASIEKSQKLNELRKKHPDFDQLYQDIAEQKMTGSELQARLQKYLVLGLLDERITRKLFDYVSLRNCHNDYIKVISKFKMLPDFGNNGPSYMAQNAIPDKKECAQTLIEIGMYRNAEDAKKLMSFFP